MQRFVRGLALAGLLLGLAWLPAQAGALRFCDHQAALSVDQKDTLLRFGGVIKDELEKSGQSVALIARSGLDLSRFDIRYSHAGVSLKASDNGPWSVRQLYFACDEGRPRIFDQGISGFLLGTDDPTVGYVSVVLLPPDAAAALERAALDKRQALALLNATYSANAYAFGLSYQNCNQWLVELLAAAWGPPAAPDEPARPQAQRWLTAQGYAPSVVETGPLGVLGAVIPWLHSDDHPREDVARGRYRVSMPTAIEAFVQGRLPGATRLEFCHNARQIVIRRGWEPIAPGCRPDAHDTVMALD